MGKGNDPNCANLTTSQALVGRLEALVPNQPPRQVLDQIMTNALDGSAPQRAAGQMAQYLTERAMSAEGPDIKPSRVAVKRPRTPKPEKVTRMGHYRAASLAALGIMLSEYPLLPEHRSRLKNSRARSSEVEEKWLRSVPDEYRIQIPGFGELSLLKGPERHWFDFAFISENGDFIPVNFKSGAVTEGAAGNTAGPHMMRFLLSGDVKRDTPDWRMPRTTRSYMAELVSQLNQDGAKINSTPRDYFLVRCDYDMGVVRAAPFMAVTDDHLKINPSNDFQIAASRAEYDLSRGIVPSVRMLLNKSLDLHCANLARNAVALGLTKPGTTQSEHQQRMLVGQIKRALMLQRLWDEMDPETEKKIHRILKSQKALQYDQLLKLARQAERESTKRVSKIVASR